MSAGHPALDARLAIHVALTAGMAWLAVLLALPGDTFDQARGWAEFAALGMESTWAMVFWAVANVGAVGLAAGRTVLRLASVLVLSTAYGCVAILMVIGSPMGSGSGTYSIMAGLGYYLAWRRTHEGI